MSDGKKKSGFMGMLSNMGLVEEVPDAHPAAPKAPGRNTPIPAAPAASYSTPNGHGTVDPDVLRSLESRLTKNCPPAYTQFMDQFDNLKEVIPDESMRFKAALKASHTTVDQLVEALNQLVGVMNTAHTEFLHAYEEQKARKLGEAEASLKATDDQIGTHEKQLQAVQETIASLRTKRETDAQAMQHKAQEIESTRSNFEATHAQVLQKLSVQLNRVQAMPRT